MLRLHPRLALTAAALLVSFSVSIGAPATAAAATYAAWWKGSDCDASHWNAIAASKGWNVTANPAHPLGASYRGVEACGPRPTWDKQGTTHAPDVGWSRSGWVEYEWECVELAMRFMGQVYGTTAYGANGWSVVSNYKTAYGGSLTKIANGTTGKSPQPGDIVSFGTTSPGHVVVVAVNAVNANGNGTITVMSQNDSGTTTGWRTVTVSAWKVAAIGGQPATRWLHQNIVTFSGLALGTVVSTQYKGQGVVFAGYNPGGTAVNPSIVSDTTSPTSPVLTGSPAFHGGVRVTFVVPGSTTHTTVGRVSLDVGHLTAANTIRVTFLDASGGTVKSVLIPSTGAYRASATGVIASVVVSEVMKGVGTFSVDNVVSAPNYT
jgi:hypothetical protein